MPLRTGRSPLATLARRQRSAAKSGRGWCRGSPVAGILPLVHETRRRWRRQVARVVEKHTPFRIPDTTAGIRDDVEILGGLAAARHCRVGLVSGQRIRSLCNLQAGVDGPVKCKKPLLSCFPIQTRTDTQSRSCRTYVYKFLDKTVTKMSWNWSRFGLSSEARGRSRRLGAIKS